MIRGAIVALLLSSSLAFGENISEAKRDDIQSLLKMTGTTRIGEQMTERVTAEMVRDLTTFRPDVSTEIIEIIRAEVSGAMRESVPVFVELLVPLYAEHFAHAEIKELIRFYKTPLGKKTVAVMPTLMQQSAVVAQQQWAPMVIPKIQARVEKRLEAEGIALPQS